jgi:hypothetical protein
MLKIICTFSLLLISIFAHAQEDTVSTETPLETPENEKPINNSNEGYEFWLFTGTNIDLLDGVKARELYLKGALLFNFKKKTNGEELPTKHWTYLTFGKNRYFSDKDSLGRIPFYGEVPTAAPGDSITIARGIYSSLRESVTDNIFVSFDYLREIESISSSKSKLFATIGLYIGLQTIKTSYSNKNFLTDTTTYLRKQDSTYISRPPVSETKIRQANYNLSVGFLHVLYTDKINVKTQLTAGYNKFTYPYSIVRNSINEFVSYTDQRNIFLQLHIDATVLDPGISIGFETFLRGGEIPLFNVSLTKVIDIQQLGSLFGKLPTIKQR